MNAFHRGVRTSARAGALLRKLAEMAVTLLLATLVLFVLTHMAPGDPVRLMLGEPEIGTANSEAYRLRYVEMRRELRLDDRTTTCSSSMACGWDACFGSTWGAPSTPGAP